jgi:hypothetical protein
VTKKRKKISGFEHSINTPGSGSLLILKPLYPNINMYRLDLFFIFNNRNVIIYYNKGEYHQKNWSNWAIKKIDAWKKIEFEFIKIDEIILKLTEIINLWQTNVYEDLEDRFNKKGDRTGLSVGQGGV